jgi:hypothetical protein
MRGVGIELPRHGQCESPTASNVLDYMTAACEVALRGETAQSLLPIPGNVKQLVRPPA